MTGQMKMKGMAAVAAAVVIAMGAGATNASTTTYAAANHEQLSRRGIRHGSRSPG